MSKWKRYTILVLLFALGWYVSPRAIAMVRFSGAHEPSLSRYFSDIERKLPSNQAEGESVRIGVPHNFWDSNEYYSALWLSRTYTHDGYYFLHSMLSTSESFKSLAKKVLTSKESYNSYGGPKMCGGYHADYILTFLDNGEHYHFMVCFGCHEVLIYSPEGSVIVDLETKAYNLLNESWEAEQ